MGKKSKEVDTGVYIIDKTQTVKTTKKNKLVFTVLGQQTELIDGYPVLSIKDAENSDLAYAKKDNNTFYIKIDDQGLLFNPMSAAPNKSDFKYKMMKNEKDKSWEFVKVSAECFEQYITMLKTRNTLYLKHAERNR